MPFLLMASPEAHHVAIFLCLGCRSRLPDGIGRDSAHVFVDVPGAQGKGSLWVPYLRRVRCRLADILAIAEYSIIASRLLSVVVG